MVDSMGATGYRLITFEELLIFAAALFIFFALHFAGRAVLGGRAPFSNFAYDWFGSCLLRICRCFISSSGPLNDCTLFAVAGFGRNRIREMS